MNKRVYGILGISSIMGNWNADFTGYPKTTSSGEVFGSDKAFKYPIKRMWENQGEKVLYIKSMKLSEGKKGEVELIPRSLKERYEYIFNEEDLKKDKDSKKVLTNLFSTIDVKNFGATFAEEGNNISITGAVQIGQGFNRYEDSYAEEQQILSPFRDASDKGNKKEDQEEAKSSTLGTKIVSNEAHYFYPFTVNPLAYKEFVELGVTEGYIEEDYRKFKEASLCAATSFATNSKVGCENEFALFVETESNLYLPNLCQYVEFEKGEEKNTISLNCGDLVNSLRDRISAVEIYYNPYTTEINTDIEEYKKYNIFTKQEV
ncbi:type I CRISPR-associated protein Cas7 [Clostridiaceae bacterium UIB06]|uniref:Type I CRISPR-associated protein Cas7 n=1 Tax=Clostridium thailandense TaxID=2794346 RepID=A0A949X2Y9_9CLOT|nr:type I CRISPR-associated protein Cas7 [Clostridium thailandense]MBV7273829.1 type I CRISPR-associated protein Cas7 [Clostridium thailandense]MCH5136906.1 type I CRISPR-associated protein Cas7 [Clostridiaceae bacterium UIB06]